MAPSMGQRYSYSTSVPGCFNSSSSFTDFHNYIRNRIIRLLDHVTFRGAAVDDVRIFVQTPKSKRSSDRGLYVGAMNEVLCRTVRALRAAAR